MSIHDPQTLDELLSYFEANAAVLRSNLHAVGSSAVHIAEQAASMLRRVLERGAR